MCDYRPQKEAKERTRIAVGGDRLYYQGEASTNTEGLKTIKLLLNRMISLADARFMTADVKTFYLNTPMKYPEYMRIPIKLIPNEIREEYKIIEFEHDGYVCNEINKGIYRLAQAGLLAN